MKAIFSQTEYFIIDVPEALNVEEAVEWAEMQLFVNEELLEECRAMDHIELELEALQDEDGFIIRYFGQGDDE